jgi:valyl-tRNA synthetase
MAEAKIKEKTWDKAFEPPIYEMWKSTKRYAFHKDSKKPTYSIDTPPPYVNSPVHIGQATTYVLMDMFARFRRMKGHNILFPLGLDRNGLPIEMAAEKQFKVRLKEQPREKAIEFCKKILETSSLATVETFLRSGISFNSWQLGQEIGDIYQTDDPYYRSLTQDTFIDLYNKGLIYESERVNNYCPGCQTTLADAEIEYEDRPAFFYDIVFTCKETGEKMIVGTTRPELVCGLAMVIFHPDDKRYSHLDGKTAISPVFNKEVPIKAHPQAVIEKGTGLEMMCSFGDLSDIRFFREQNIPPIFCISSEGRMNNNAGFLDGMKIMDARKKMIEELEKQSLLVKTTPTANHRTPVCERSKDPIEFISMREYYVKQVEYKEKMLELAEKINFFAPESRQIMKDWINSVTIDWPISRRRFYATEVPLWYCKKCGEVIVPQKGKYHQPWHEPSPVAKCPKCGGTEFRGDERVFDTWFDSSISPLYILKYSRDPEFFEKNTPCSVRPQGKEIIRTWLYYTVLKDYLLTGKCIFKDAWINYHIVDDKGYKMSKSKGNVVDPKIIIDKYGAEPFRLWCAAEGNLEKTDLRCSFDRIEGTGKTLVKLWNVAKFISMFPEPGPKMELTEIDKWIIGEVNELIRTSEERYTSYDFHNPAIKMKNFIWEIFSSHYIELAKNRAYNQNHDFTDEEQNAALFTLRYCLQTLLKLMAPITPFITYKLYMELWEKDIHAEDFPAVEHELSPKLTTDKIVELNSFIWKAKKDKGLALNSEIAELTVPEEFRVVEKDLKMVHKAKQISYGALNATI